MDPNTFPTKGNLINAKNTLNLSNQGYELLDKKRNVLIKEIMELNDKALEIQTKIDEVFSQAYKALQTANIENGISNIERLSYGVPIENSVKIKFHSIMGVEIPKVSYDDSCSKSPKFGFATTTSSIDYAFIKFSEVKELIIYLSMIENAAYRLAVNIKKLKKGQMLLKM